MNTKYTPGPWTTIKHDTLRDTYEIADKVGYERKTVAVGVNKANARLIAAAPELLEALNALVVWMDASELSKTKHGGVGAFRYEGHEYSVVTQARAAISRATGE